MHPNKTKGLIFNIQRFSIHDGPGIRTTVFMKGCPLRCRWCSNPESFDSSPDLMIRDINCRGCGTCVDACPTGAVTLTPEAGRKVAREKCDRCLKCVDACIYDSLNTCGRYMEVKEVLDEVIKDEMFYKNSGGGLTVSGGEALVQAEFVGDLLKTAKQKGLHTVLDTTGYAAWEKMEHLLAWVDLILWDIKHLDPGEHKRATGVSNSLSLKNLEKASKITDIWLRIPLIAGFNDSDAHARDLVVLGKRVDAKKLSLLPYHEGGKSKSEQLGLTYPMPQAKAPAKEVIDHLQKFFEKEGFKTAIGN